MVYRTSLELRGSIDSSEELLKMVKWLGVTPKVQKMIISKSVKTPVTQLEIQSILKY